MMKVWNMVLIAATFFLCIYGTFLTRSGIISSVHAFAESPIGKYFVGFLAIGIAATVWLILDRLDYLQERSGTRKRGFARIELPVQQPDSAGQLLRGSVGHACSRCISEKFADRKDQPRCRLVQSPDGADRTVPAVSDRRRPAVRVAPHFDGKPAQELPVAGHRHAGCGRRAVRRRHALSVLDHFARPLLLRRRHDRDGVFPRRERHQREDRSRLHARR